MLSETKKYRRFTEEQKTEIVLASLRSEDRGREHDTADKPAAEVE